MVECFDLTVHDLGDTFAEEFQGRRLWCRQHCEHEFTVQPIWDCAQGRDMGRCCFFADQIEATMFRLTWG